MLFSVAENIYQIGVNDPDITLFEGQYPVSHGMAYNSYCIVQNEIAILDTVDIHCKEQWFENVSEVLNGRRPTYLVLHHLEPDHSALIDDFMTLYPDTLIVLSKKAAQMLPSFVQKDYTEKLKIVNENEILKIGDYELQFIMAPFVHWPEVMMSYERKTQTFFSADAFGKFNQNNLEEDWLEEARRYYFGIVGKYGLQVRNLFKKIETLPIRTICSLHGPVLQENLSYYLQKYALWAAYDSENEKDILIVYTSVYGNTKKACEILKEEIQKNSNCQVILLDLSKTEISVAVGKAFEYKKIVLATTTYNNGLFPSMQAFLNGLLERNFQKKTIGIIENGSWAPLVEKEIYRQLQNCAGICYLTQAAHLLATLKENNIAELQKMAQELID